MDKNNTNKRIRILIELVILIVCVGLFLDTYSKPLISQKKSPDTAVSLYYQGKAWEEQGRDDLALEAFKRSIQLDPNIGKVHTMLGVVYTNKGLFNEAENEYRKALQLNIDESNRTITHHNLGILYLEGMGLYDKAIAEYEASIKLSPKPIVGPADSYEGLARAYLAKVDSEKAISEAKRSIEFNPEPQKGYAALGEAYLQKKDIESARGAYEKLKDLDEDLAEELDGRIKKAEKEYSQLQELAASGCFEKRINAACFYNRAFFEANLPPGDFYKDYYKKLNDVIRSGWKTDDQELKELLNKNQDAINDFKKAAELENCDFSFGKTIDKTEIMFLSQYSKGTMIAKLVLAQGRLLESENKAGLALDDYLRVLRFAKHLGGQKDFILINKTEEAIVQRLACMPLAQYINREVLNPKTCQKLLNDLVSLRNKEVSFEAALADEKEITKLRIRTLKGMKGEKRREKDFDQKFYLEFDKLLDKNFEYLTMAYKKNDPKTFLEKIHQERAEFNRENPVWVLALEALKSQIGLPGRADSPVWNAKLIYPAGMVSGLVNTIPKYYVSLTELDILITATAIKLYQSKEHKIPVDLQALIPVYLAQLPKDPFDDFKPLKYKQNGTGWIIYSFGPDVQDGQAGLQYNEYNANTTDDIIFSSGNYLPARRSDNYDMKSFTGTWNSSQVGKITLNSDGTWRVSNCNFGKWFLRDNNIVWTYSDKPEMEDVNPILKYKPDEFILKEMNGSTTVFKKVK